MRLLLDTHALLWWLTDDDRLSEAARAAISQESNPVFVSAASAWEIATKARIGKLSGVPGLVERFAELVAAEGFTPLPSAQSHALRAGGYALAHRDPFDRMLAAQSEVEALVLVTRDPVFADFGSVTLW